MRFRNLLILFLLILSCNSEIKNNPQAIKGEIDLRKWEFQKDGIINLDGEWDFYWDALLTPEDFEKKEIFSKEYIKFPDTWNDKIWEGKKLSSNGYATFRLKVKFKENEKPIAFRFREQATAFKVFWNNKEISETGRVGKTKLESKPAYENKEIFLESPKKDSEIIIWISNFHHRSGGAWHSIELGSHQDILKEVQFFREMEVFLFGIIFIMVLYHLFLFYYRRSDFANILFSIFCFIILSRSLSTGERIFHSFISIPFDIYIRIEYFTFFIISPVGFHFLNSQFPGKLLRRVTISNYLISGIVSLSLFLPTNYFTEVILKYQFIFFIYLILGFSFLFYFTLKGFQGAKLLTSGLLVVLIFAINDILYSNLIINSLFLAHYGIAFLIFTQSLGISIRFSKAFASIENLTKNLKEVNQSYRRFVPKEFLRFLNKSEITEISLGEQVQSEMTILFSDIRSFTELSEKMSPGDNFNFLNSYLSRMGPIVRGHDGFIDKYIGDGIMALFPGEVEDAINSAIAMQKEIRVYNKHRMKSNYDGIKVGIGVHTGTLILGTIGEEQRMESTVISDAVNLASRIEGLTKTYGAYILISEHSFNLIKDKNIYKYRLLDKVKVKGKSNYTLVYEIFDGMPEYLLEIYLKTKNDFEKGLHLYWKENYRDAIHYFNRVKSELPLDLANNRFLELSKMEINK